MQNIVVFFKYMYYPFTINCSSNKMKLFSSSDSLIISRYSFTKIPFWCMLTSVSCFQFSFPSHWGPEHLWKFHMVNMRKSWYKMVSLYSASVEKIIDTCILQNKTQYFVKPNPLPRKSNREIIRRKIARADNILSFWTLFCSKSNTI